MASEIGESFKEVIYFPNKEKEDDGEYKKRFQIKKNQKKIQVSTWIALL